jgi:hypothetical protein
MEPPPPRADLSGRDEETVGVNGRKEAGPSGRFPVA